MNFFFFGKDQGESILKTKKTKFKIKQKKKYTAEKKNSKK